MHNKSIYCYSNERPDKKNYLVYVVAKTYQHLQQIYIQTNNHTIQKVEKITKNYLPSIHPECNGQNRIDRIEHVKCA